MEGALTRIYERRPLVRQDDIRVLQIEPATDIDEPIRCTLAVISLEHKELKYQALSYAWGSTDKDCNVMCDGEVLPVTVNLYQALRRIRQNMNAEKGVRFSCVVWADAVCIDQQAWTRNRIKCQ